VDSNKVVPKLNAALLQGRGLNYFARAGSSYTKAESDSRYARLGSAYTRAESDARYPLKTAGYTKSESDAKYAPRSSSYTKSESDGRYAPKTGSTAYASAGSLALLSQGFDSFEGQAMGNTISLVTLESLRAPAAGKIVMTAIGTCTSEFDEVSGTLRVRVGGVENEATQTLSSGAGIFCRVESTKSVIAQEAVSLASSLTANSSFKALFKGVVVVHFVAS
jgi:hypothetical protein